MHKDIFITGYGMASSLGNGVESNWNAATKLQTGIDRHALDDDSTCMVGWATQFSDKDKLYDMSVVAFDEMLAMSGLTQEELSSSGLVYSHGSPNNEFIVREANRITKSGRGRPDIVYRIMNSYVGAKLAKAYEINEAVIANSSACCGSAQSIHLGLALINSGQVDRVICGGGEVIDKFTQKAFKSMRIVLSQGEQDAESVKPYGDGRDGIILGEGVGFVVLETQESVEKRQAKPLAKLSSSVFRNIPDAIFGDLPHESIWEELIQRQVDPSDIDFVFGHGTSTAKGDLIEGKALSNCLPGVPVTSTKYLFGHTLSASCILDLALGLRCIETQTIIGSGTHFELDEELKGLNMQKEATQTKVKNIMKISAGFGGGASVIQMSAVD